MSSSEQVIVSLRKAREQLDNLVNELRTNGEERQTFNTIINCLTSTIKYLTPPNSFEQFIAERLKVEVGCETSIIDIKKEYTIWLMGEPDAKKVYPADCRVILIGKFGNLHIRKNKEMVQNVRILDFFEN
jgi:hypothetical protein